MISDFTAVLLAGGRSSRMGCDKAFLPWGPLSIPLWRWQMEKLQALRPHRLLLSCRPDQNFAVGDTGIMPVHDDQPDCGPLGGIAAALAVCETPCLLVLGVDLPALPCEVLATLLKSATDVTGAVHAHAAQPDLREPMAMVLPGSSLETARMLLAGGRPALQPFLRILAGKGQLQTLPPVADPSWFQNLNRPGDC